MDEIPGSLAPTGDESGSAFSALEALVAQELNRAPRESARPLVGEIRRRLGDSLTAVLFYGSCLRKDTDEGVLDFYAIVDDYSSAHRKVARTLANAIYPPSVFYIEVKPGEATERESPTLRAKYAVMSSRDLLRAASPGGLRSGVWARFCQPAVIAYARDEGSRKQITRVAAQSILTALRCALPLLPENARRGDELQFSAEELWQVAFAETYSNEMRPESDDSVRTLVAANPDRYERAAKLGLAALQASGDLTVVAEPAQGRLCVALASGAWRRQRLRWRVRKPFAKIAYTVQLLKTAFTFGDSGVPYALWKVERHTGIRFEPTERQRRHPFIFGWPIIFQILRARALR